MPILSSKNLLNAEIEILKLVSFIYSKEDDSNIEPFFLTSPLLNLTRDAKKEVNPLSQTLLVFYGCFFSICQRLCLSKQQFLAEQVGLRLSDFGETINPSLLTIDSIGELIRQSLQPFIGNTTAGRKKNKIACELPEYIGQTAFRQALLLLFDFTVINEDHWGVMAGLESLLFEVAKMSPALPPKKSVISISLADIIQYRIDAMVTNKPKEEMKYQQAAKLEDNFLRLFKHNLLELSQSSEESDLDALMAFDLPLQLPPELKESCFEYIQMDFAFILIQVLNSRKLDQSNVLFYIDKFSKLGYFPDWLKLDKSPSESGFSLELSIFKANILLALRLLEIKTSSLILDNTETAIDKKLYQLGIALLPLITPDTMQSISSSKLEALALHLLQITKTYPNYYKNELEKCLFFLRPLHIVALKIERTQDILLECIGIAQLKHVVDVCINLLKEKSWTLLSKLDQRDFFRVASIVLCQTQPTSKDLAFYELSNSLVVLLCQNNLLKEAIHFLRSRIYVDINHVKTKKEPIPTHLYQQDTNLFHLLQFLNALPKEDILSTTAPMALVKHMQSFGNTLKAHDLNLATPNAQSYIAHIMEISPDLLELLFPGLRACLKVFFFTKNKFFEFLIHMSYFLNCHFGLFLDTFEHQDFKNMIVKIAHVLDVAEASSLLATLEDDRYLERMNVIHFGIKAEIAQKKEQDELVMLEVSKSSHELASDRDNDTSPNRKVEVPHLKTDNLLIVIEVGLKSFYKKLSQHEQQFSNAPSLPVLVVDQMMLVGCSRFYNEKTGHYTVQNQEHLECWFLFLTCVTNLLNIPLKAVVAVNKEIKKGFEDFDDITKDLSPTGQILAQKVLKNVTARFSGDSNMQLFVETKGEYLSRDKEPFPQKKAASSHVPSYSESLTQNTIAAASVLMTDFFLLIKYLKSHSAMKKHLLESPLGIETLDRIILFGLLHEHIWPTDANFGAIIQLRQSGSMSLVETQFYDYLSAIYHRALPIAVYSENPFIRAYQEIMTNPNIGLKPLPVLDYTGLPSYLVTWNKLFLADCFSEIINKHLQVSRLHADTLSLRNQHLAQSNYVIDCKDIDATAHPLSFVKTWMKYATSLRANYSLKVNPDVVKRERALDTTHPRFFPFSNVFLNFDQTAFRWFDRMKSVSLSPANTYFVFTHASNYMLGRLPLPTENKIHFLRQLLSIFLTSKEDKTVLASISNLELNSFLELLLKEGMQDEAIELLSGLIKLAAPELAITPQESKFYKALMTVLQLGGDAEARRSNEKKGQFKTALSRVTDEFLAKTFRTITKSILLEIISEKHVSRVESPSVGFDVMFDEPLEKPKNNDKKKKKKNKKKDKDKDNKITADPSEVIAATKSTPVKLPDEARVELKPVVAGGIVLTTDPILCVQNEPLEELGAIEEIVVATVPVELYSESVVNQADKPLLTEEKKPSPAPIIYSPTTNLFSPLKSPVVLPQNPLIISKYIKNVAIPSSIIALVGEINKVSKHFSVALVGKNMHRLFLEKTPLTEYMPYELLVIFSQIDNPNPNSNPKEYFKNLLRSFEMVYSCNNSPNLQKQISLSLVSDQVQIPIEIDLIEQTRGQDRDQILADYTFNTIFNIESLCIPFWQHTTGIHGYPLMGSRAALRSLGHNEISFTQQELPPLEEKLTALLLLANFELQYPYPELKRDRILSTFPMDDLAQCMTLLTHPDNLANYLQFVSTQALLFSSHSLIPVVLKINELHIIQSLTGIEPYHIAQTIGALIPCIQGDNYTQIKYAWLYVYQHYCSFYQDIFKQNPTLLMASPLRHFLFKFLQEADHCHLEVIEAAAELRITQVLIFDNEFFVMFQHVVSHYETFRTNQNKQFEIQQQEAFILEQQLVLERMRYEQQQLQPVTGPLQTMQGYGSLFRPNKPVQSSDSVTSYQGPI